MPDTCWMTERWSILSRYLLMKEVFEGSKSDQAILVGGGWADMTAANTELEKRWQGGIVGQFVVLWWQFYRGNQRINGVNARRQVL